ncbi:MAG: hypothetical protein J6K55_13650 [Clostridia bacterium]|nr:hypothetical protein [Clostridia bacterium]
MERTLTIPKNKVKEIIMICNNAAGGNEIPTKDGARTMADGLDQFLEQILPYNAHVIGQLDCLLAELHDNEIYDLVYLYALGKAWVMNPDNNNLYEYKQNAQGDVREFRNRGRNEAIDYIVGNLFRVSKYLSYAEKLLL